MNLKNSKNGYGQHLKKMKLNKKDMPEGSATADRSFPIQKQKMNLNRLFKKNIKSGFKNNMKMNAKDSLKNTMRGPNKRNSKKGLPLGSLVGMILIFAFISVGYWNYEFIESFLGRVEISILGQAQAESHEKVEEKKTPHTNAKKENTASAKSPETKTTTATNATMTSEEMALFNSLQERKKQLDQRETELKKLEEELHKQKEELEKRLADLEQLRSKIGNQLQERVSSDAEKVDKLVSFYSNMKPQKAAKVFETMNEDLAVEILLKMKKKEAAEVMNIMEADKARKLSEKFAGYRKN